MSRSSLLLAASAIVAIPAPALAQQVPIPADPQPTPAPDPDPAPDPAEDPGDEIVVVGERVRGSAIGEVAPVATLGSEAITALGATNLTELLQRLRGVTTSSSGADPVFLLNGRRISGFSEMQGIPPEAIERTEVLPEQEAPRFGFPPTVRIVNIITKRQFRSIAVQQLAGTSTEGGAATNYAETTATRIEGDRRTSLTASYLRQNRLLQSQRDVLPDPASPFTIDGTTPADIGPFRTLEPRNDRVRVDGTVAAPLSKQVAGSLNLSMEARRADGLNGPAPGVLSLPGDGGDGLLFRYFPQAVLRQRTTDLTLHAGGTLQGSARRWTWNATATYDRVRGTVAADQGVPLAGLQAAIERGGDPLAPLDPATARTRLRGRSATTTGTLVGKMVATGPVLRLPAGDAQVTVTSDLARSDSDARTLGTGLPGIALSRTTKGASVAIDAPIVSPSGDFLPFLGRLGANASVGVSGVSDFGRLASSSVGLSWTPTPPLQLTASVSDARAAPAIALLTNPLLEAPNVPFFDFVTGTSALVTTRTGGNPALAPERRRIVTLGTALKPFAKREFRLTLDYLDTRITDQSIFPGGATTDFQRAFTDRYVRDASGRLILADLRPVNIAEEVERKLRFGVNLWTPIGRAPPPPKPPAPPPADAPPPKPPRQRPTLYVSGSATWRLSDEVVLQPGTPRLDLLDGATLNGADGRPRWEVEGNVSGSIGPANLGVYGRLQGPARIRSTLPAADLDFSGRTWLVVYGFLDAEKLLGKPWARRMSLNLTVENLLNDRILVRNRLGETPFRYQGALIDPIGRSLRLGVRKLF